MKRRVTLVVLLLALVAAACGSDAGSGDGIASLESDELVVAAGESGEIGGSDQEEPGDELSPEEAMLALTQCMRENGVEVNDPEFDADGNFRFSSLVGQGQDFDREAVQLAFESCSEYIEGVSQQFQRLDRIELEDTIYEYAACMRDNGYDMPDPDFSDFGPGAGGGEGGPGKRPFGDLDPDDPAFQAANEACGEILGGFGLTPGAGRPGAGG